MDWICFYIFLDKNNLQIMKILFQIDFISIYFE